MRKLSLKNASSKCRLEAGVMARGEHSHGSCGVGVHFALS